MAPFRNPFTRRTTATNEHARPDSSESRSSHVGFERVDTIGSITSSALSMHSGASVRSVDTGDYKMSVVNDSGIYLPPSPTDEKGLWPRKYDSVRISTDRKTSVGEIDHFGISRESFDSYRRSFDVSAKSPVLYEVPARGSLDSSRFPRLPRSALDNSRRRYTSKGLPMPEEFEDVGLDDKTPAAHHATTRKRGFFSKFTTTSTTTEPIASDGQTSVSRWIGGRKRAISNSVQESELKPMERPMLVISTSQSDIEKDDDAETPTEAHARI